MTVVEEIYFYNDTISDRIDRLDEPSLVNPALDVLKLLRDFTERVAILFFYGKEVDDIDYKKIETAKKEVKKEAKYKFWHQFYFFLENSTSHYAIREEGSERLLLKYYENMLFMKNYLFQNYNIKIFNNLYKILKLYGLETNNIYYEKIADVINNLSGSNRVEIGKYYIVKNKPFFVNGKIYYEVTILTAFDYESKSHRLIVFSDQPIMSNYAAKISLIKKEVTINSSQFVISIINKFDVSIRDCEFKNFCSLINGTLTKVSRAEQKSINEFITKYNYSLNDVCLFDDDMFDWFLSEISKNSKLHRFVDILKICRKEITNASPGSNVIRYLLHTMRNRIIKLQRGSISNMKLSGFFLDNKCIPFDQHPYNFSLKAHNPSIYDLLSCLEANNNEHELLARFIKINTEINRKLFTHIDELSKFDDIKGLIRKYNRSLYHTYYDRCRLICKNNHVFINGYKDDVIFIISKLKKLSNNYYCNYEKEISYWLQKDDLGSLVDCDEKRNVMKTLFKSSSVGFIYGSAGTGKSTLINHFANFFEENSKLFLTQTNSALDNLRRKIKVDNSEFTTIYKFNRYEIVSAYDLIVIDECSTISNQDFRNFIEKANFNLLLLVGDEYQINSIRFGNWFSLAKRFLKKTCVYELTTPYRSKSTSLQKVWNNARTMEPNIMEVLEKNDCSCKLDQSLFNKDYDDEIILCLNYDGLYGVNNINRVLQSNNSNSIYEWNHQIYKINDPILFTDNNRFSPILHNNLKGKIIDISIQHSDSGLQNIEFIIEVDKFVKSIDAIKYDFELLNMKEDGKSVIRFNVSEPGDIDDDNTSKSAEVPFQIAYASSIHKAQGLEFDSVKVIISEDVEEHISHNIFYTAITRAKEKLKIYWSPNTENNILKTISPLNSNKDFSILTNCYLI